MSTREDMKAMGALCDQCPLNECPGPIPAEANSKALFAAVGSYPGDHEVKQERVFVGPAGKEVTNTLGTLGIRRRHVHWTNVVMCQPPGSDLTRVTATIEKANTKARKAWEKDMRAYKKAQLKAGGGNPFSAPVPPVPPVPKLTPMEACRPRLVTELSGFTNIVTMGTRSSKTLLGRHASIMKSRGGMVEGALRYDPETNVVTTLSVNEDEPLPDGHRRVRIVPVFEPSFVLRAKRWSKAFTVDLGRAVAWFQNRLTFHEPTIIYHPSPADLAVFLRKDVAYAYDVETDNIECLSASMRCIAIGDSNTVVVIGLRTKDAYPKPVVGPPTVGVPQDSPWYTPEDLAQVLLLLREWMERPDRVKVGHNAGYYDLLNVWTQLGIRAVNTLDTILLHRLVESELPHNLGFVASIYAPAVKAWKADRDGRKIALEAESDEELHHYCALDVANTHRVLEPLMLAVKIRDQTKLIAKDHRVQAVCAGLHEIGMYVDQERREEHESALIKSAVTLRAKLRDLTGREDFNPGSRDQCADLWFSDWKLEHPASLDPELRFTKSGSLSTADVVVRSLLGLPKLDPVRREALLTHRMYKKAQKVLGTYVAKLRLKSDFVPMVGEDDEEDFVEMQYRKRYGIAKKGIVWPDGRVRPGYNAHVTNVGRLSSSSPFNAQNVPKWLRDMIVPAPGHIFVGADQDQFHIRIFAALWKIEKYLEAFARKADPHAATADSCFPMSNATANNRFRSAEGFPGGKWDGDYFIPDGEGDWGGTAKAIRDLAKRVQFLSAYAGGVDTVWSLLKGAENKSGDLIYLDLSMREARTMHSNWLAGVPEVTAGWETEQALYDAYGYLAGPIDGRRKDFLDGAKKQELANYRTLATEAALMNRSMIQAVDAIPFGRWGPGTGLLTQTHDAMVFEVPADGVYEENGAYKATKGTPAWEAWHVLQETMNYTHPKLPGVEFTSTPSIARRWAKVG
jgi:DNA polymerase I-like protein with 3'-5' exonuclease and polymerase domains/uracil-DNA glycosylase